MKDLLPLIQSILPSLIGLMGGGSFVTFFMWLIKRNDARQKRRQDDELLMTERGKVYQRAFWLCDGYAKNLWQLVGSLPDAKRDGNEKLVDGIIEILANFIGTENENGKWQMKPYPDWLNFAREEMKVVDGGPRPLVKEDESDGAG